MLSETKHEYLDGAVFAMAGASKNHERIAGNVFAELRAFLKNKPCEPFASDIKIRVGTKFFYPDVMVVCEEPNPHDEVSFNSVGLTLAVEEIYDRVENDDMRVPFCWKNSKRSGYCALMRRIISAINCGPL